MSLLGYPEYKSSGTWLGKIPAHWISVRLKHLLSDMGSGGTPDTDNTSFWAETDPGTPWVAIGDMSDRAFISETVKALTSEGLASKGLTVWPAGTLLFSMYASLGHTAELTMPAATNQAILALLPAEDVNQHFLSRWLEFLKPRLREQASSNTQDNLNAEKVRNLLALRPPLDEQGAIADFLDHETAKIDALIAEQEKLLALLAEKRQAIISHAVTRGLNPHAPLKESGIPWLGHVPAHWAVSGLGFHLEENPCYGVLVPDIDPGGVPMLRITDIVGGRAEKNSLNTISPALAQQYQRTFLQKGDVVLSVVGTIGTSLVVDDELAGINLSRALARLVPAATLRPGWLSYLLQSRVFEEFVNLTCVGTAQRVLNMDDLRCFRIPVPSIDVQDEVVAWLAQRVSENDALSEEATHAVAVLAERRSALIAAAVTGQIDVRGAVEAQAV